MSRLKMGDILCSDEVERAALWERFAPLHEQVQTESDEYTPGFQVRTPEEQRENNVDAEAALLWLLVVCLYWLNGCLITERDLCVDSLQSGPSRFLFDAMPKGLTVESFVKTWATDLDPDQKITARL